MLTTFETCLLHLGAAWLAGCAIGLERTFHGRPAGFRTHALVSLASAILMMLPLLPWGSLGGGDGAGSAESVTNGVSAVSRSDPMRIAQGIMTGIGFLGAGVIYKDGFSVRGLTTAASIWITAAIGLLFGAGLFFIGTAATVATLGTLAVFRVIEDVLPRQSFVRLTLVFERADAPDEAQVVAFVRDLGFTVQETSYRTGRRQGSLEYDFILKTTRADAASGLAEALRHRRDLIEFRLSPSGE